MKKILAFVLAVMMLASLCVLGGCSDNSEKTGTADEVSPLDNAVLVGAWKVVSTDDEITWLMNSEETLHITETANGQNYTTVCRYTYDKSTGDFEYVGLSSSTSLKGTLVAEGSVIRINNKENQEVIILSKIR